MAEITRNSTISSPKLKVVSLFCGCGGMDLGLLGGFDFLNKRYEKLPYEIIYSADNDKYATAIYNDNFTHQAEIKDVKDIKADELPSHDILLGGFPCQSFSIVAQNPPRLGYKDEKGQLFFEMVRILKVKQPRFFIAENVKGLLSANKKQAFPMIIREFEKAGYYVKFQLLNASEYGVPQKRERVFIIGFREKQDYGSFRFPVPIIKDGNKKVALRQVLEFHADNEEKWFFSQKAVDGMMRVRNKMNKGRAQNINEPCNTISSHLSKVSLNSTDPVLFVDGRYRRFTPREACSIQSFPNSFKLDAVSDNRQYRAIGNAVPPVMMWYVANALIDILK